MTLDKKSQKQMMITLALIPVLALITFKSMSDIKRIKESHKKPPSPPQASPVLPPGGIPPGGPAAVVPAHPTIPPDEIWDKLEKETHSLEIERDPFSVYSPIKVQGAVLSGIFWDEFEPRVIIDGMLLRRGERVGKYTVRDIKKDRVLIDDGQTQKELTIEY